MDVAVPNSEARLSGTTFGVCALVGIIGLFGGWAVTARLDSAISAPGVVVVENARKSVQHLEGGVVESISVREAQVVTAGQELLTLAPVSARADAEILRRQLAVARIRHTRLIAEREGLAAFELPGDLSDAVLDPVLATALESERRQFNDRRAAIAAQIAVLQARREQLTAERAGYMSVRSLTERQRASLADEIARMAPLAAAGDYSKNTLAASERNLDMLDARLAELEASIGRVGEAIIEADRQAEQVIANMRQEREELEAATLAEIAELTSRLAVAQDVLTRQAVRAPVSGTVQNLAVHTVGAVVGSGQVLAEIVPLRDDLVLDVRISPSDITHVALGAQGEVRFHTSGGRVLPVIMGSVISISADAMPEETDPRLTFFRARVRIAPDDLPVDRAARMVPGMPAEVLIVTGTSTAWEYLTEPLFDAAWRGMREP